MASLLPRLMRDARREAEANKENGGENIKGLKRVDSSPRGTLTPLANAGNRSVSRISNTEFSASADEPSAASPGFIIPAMSLGNVTPRTKARRSRIATKPVATFKQLDSSVEATAEDLDALSLNFGDEAATPQRKDTPEPPAETEEADEMGAALQSLDEKIDKLRSTGRQRTRTRHGKKKLERQNLVDTVMTLFENLSPRDLVGELAIVFDGEEAIDAGGVSNEMYTQFFLALFDCEMGYFEASAGGHTLLPIAAQSYSKKQLKGYETIGKVMIKAVLDRIPIPRGLSQAFFCFLCGGESSLTPESLKEYDHTVFNSVSFVLEAEDPELIEAMCLTFPESEREVTHENVQEFVAAMVHNVLLGSRQGAMEAMCKGMASIGSLHDHLRTLRPPLVQGIVCGPEHISAAKIVEHIHFADAEFEGSEVPHLLRQLLTEWSQEQLSHFLSFTTGVANLQPDGSMNNAEANPPDKIKVMKCLCAACKCSSGQCQQLPVASTCFWTLRLPLCDSAEVLDKRFKLAFEWGGGFGDL